MCSEFVGWFIFCFVFVVLLPWRLKGLLLYDNAEFHTIAIEILVNYTFLEFQKNSLFVYTCIFFLIEHLTFLVFLVFSTVNYQDQILSVVTIHSFSCYQVMTILGRYRLYLAYHVYRYLLRDFQWSTKITASYLPMRLIWYQLSSLWWSLRKILHLYQL